MIISLRWCAQRQQSTIPIPFRPVPSNPITWLPCPMPRHAMPKQVMNTTLSVLPIFSASHNFESPFAFYSSVVFISFFYPFLIISSWGLNNRRIVDPSQIKQTSSLMQKAKFFKFHSTRPSKNWLSASTRFRACVFAMLWLGGSTLSAVGWDVMTVYLPSFRSVPLHSECRGGIQSRASLCAAMSKWD